MGKNKTIKISLKQAMLLFIVVLILLIAIIAYIFFNTKGENTIECFEDINGDNINEHIRVDNTKDYTYTIYINNIKKLNEREHASAIEVYDYDKDEINEIVITRKDTYQPGAKVNDIRRVYKLENNELKKIDEFDKNIKDTNLNIKNNSELLGEIYGTQIYVNYQDNNDFRPGELIIYYMYDEHIICDRLYQTGVFNSGEKGDYLLVELKNNEKWDKFGIKKAYFAYNPMWGNEVELHLQTNNGKLYVFSYPYGSSTDADQFYNTIIDNSDLDIEYLKNHNYMIFKKDE